MDNLNLYLTHGNKYNIENKNKFNEGDILIYGHKHYPFIKKEDNIIFINVGSISLPKNESKASYAIYENRIFSIYSVDDELVLEIKL